MNFQDGKISWTPGLRALNGEPGTTRTRSHNPPVTLNDFPLPGSNQPPPYSAGINHNRSITYIGVEHGIDLLGLGELAEVPVPVQKGLGTVQDLHVAFTD